MACVKPRTLRKRNQAWMLRVWSKYVCGCTLASLMHRIFIDKRTKKKQNK